MTPLPSYVDREAWEDYEAMRRKIRKPMTVRVIRQKLARLAEFKAKGHDVTRVIDEATNGCWLDFYEPREKPISSVKDHASDTRVYLDSLEQQRVQSLLPSSQDAARVARLALSALKVV